MRQLSTATRWYKKIRSSFIFNIALKFAHFFERILRRKVIPKYTALPFFEWLREKDVYYEFVYSHLLNDNSLIWSILIKKKVIGLFDDFIKRKNHLHKFLINIIDLEIFLRLLCSLKLESSTISMISTVLDKNFEIKS